MKTINLHIYPTNIKLENRILKETLSIAKLNLFDSIVIVGIKEAGDKERDQLDDIREIHLISLKTDALPPGQFWKIFKYLELFLKILSLFKSENVVAVNCHSLYILPVGMLFKICKKSKIIYDAHELETEVAMSKVRKATSKIVERLLIYHADIIIVVNDSIADWYKSHYKLKIVNVIKNYPAKQDAVLKQSNILKEQFNIGDNQILYIFQGMLSELRGVDILLRVFSQLDTRIHIVFMGSGPMQKLIMRDAEKYPNIHYKTAVSPGEIVQYTSSADVGLNILRNTCLNNYYSLPNKIFEYIISGLPVIVSDFPEMGKIVDDNNIGWKVPVDEASIINLIKSISKHDIAEKRWNALKCRGKFIWDTEDKVLSAVYTQYFRQYLS